jgi:hypothetical protein
MFDARGGKKFEDGRRARVLFGVVVVRTDLLSSGFSG